MRTRPARPSAVAALLLAVLLPGPGCGGGPAAAGGPPDDARKVVDVVDALNETIARPKGAEALFVAGAAPAKAEFKRYARFSYWSAVGDPPAIDGDAARMKVTIRDERSGEDAGQVEWTFRREGDGWKIAAAPLP
jgi:hypothetical protein